MFAVSDGPNTLHGKSQIIEVLVQSSPLFDTSFFFLSFFFAPHFQIASKVMLINQTVILHFSFHFCVVQ